jgi:hypothetical protein
VEQLAKGIELMGDPLGMKVGEPTEGEGERIGKTNGILVPTSQERNPKKHLGE